MERSLHKARAEPQRLYAARYLCRGRRPTGFGHRTKRSPGSREKTFENEFVWQKWGARSPSANSASFVVEDKVTKGLSRPTGTLLRRDMQPRKAQNTLARSP